MACRPYCVAIRVFVACARDLIIEVIYFHTIVEYNERNNNTESSATDSEMALNSRRRNFRRIALRLLQAVCLLTIVLMLLSSLNQAKLHPTQHATPPKQLGVIYMLTQGKRMHHLSQSLASLDTNFNNKYGYPIVIFYEQKDAAFNEESVRNATKSHVLFQPINFRLPPHINQSMLSTTQCTKSFPIGYRHMCRFQAIGVYEQAILDDYEYALRLDDDSRILRPIDYDIFEFARRRRVKYGYVLESGESMDCVAGLHEAVGEYIVRNNATPFNVEAYMKWPKYRIVYNNFELMSAAFWKSAEYSEFVRFIDSEGGIYYRRWGDAPIKTIAMNLLLHRNETHRFADIGYRHQGHSNP